MSETTADDTRGRPLPSLSNRRYKSAVYEQISRVGKAVASPRRVELLDLLCQAPATVDTLARRTGMSRANASQHLRVLRAAGLVEADKDGLHVTCHLPGPEVPAFFLRLRGLAAERLGGIDRLTRRFLEDRGVLEAVDRATLLERARRREVLVLDVRPRDEYAAAHLPGAVSIPLPELESRLAELPRERQIVAYCRGPYCVLSVDAVRLLRERGFNAARLEDGVPEWRASGLEIATGLRSDGAPSPMTRRPRRSKR